MREKSGRERRAHARTEVLLKVEYQQPRGLLFDYLSNVGSGGLFIHTNVAFEVGQELGFSISFPGLLDPIFLRGVVRWKQQVGPDVFDAGVGVEFLFDSEEQRSEIGTLLRRVREGEDASPPEQPLRVLLVEDNELVQELFQHALRRYTHGSGYQALEVVIAPDGPVALKHIARGGFDLAIIDQYLPSMKGTRLVRRLREDERYRTLPILMVSVGGDEVRQQASEAGADGYLGKPVLLKQLVETLRRLAPA